MKLLLISNSTNVGEEYLDYLKQRIKEFLSGRHINAGQKASAAGAWRTR